MTLNKIIRLAQEKDYKAYNYHQNKNGEYIIQFGYYDQFGYHTMEFVGTLNEIAKFIETLD